MNNLVYLRPGTPNDDNREYLPESIKGSDMVVNENGNNSIPYPEGLEENHGVLVDDGIPDTWYVYVPKTYVYRALLELNDIGRSSAAGFLQSLLGFICVVTANAVVNKIDSESALF